jgi:hypothetical protein
MSENAMLRLFRPRTSLVVLLMALLLALFFARWMPHGSLPALEGDSSIFLYIGQQVNSGLMPYVDAWEDKPPLIFWLDAFSLRFTPRSARGIVCLAFPFVLAFFIAIWFLLRARVGAYPAIFALLLGVNLLPEVMLNPNMTEVFSLPLQAISFLLLCREAEDGPRGYYPILQGLLAAALFQLRPNNGAVIALYVVVNVVEHIRRRAVRRLLASLATFLVAFAIGNAAVLWPIVARGCFRQYWDAVFRFGSEYSRMRPAIMHVYAVGVGLLKISRFGGSVIAGAAVAAVAATRPSWTNVQDRFSMLAVTLLGMEVMGAAVSGRAFEHYFMMWLLPATVLAGLFVNKCGDAIGVKRFAVASFCGACAILLGGSMLDSAREAGEVEVKFQDGRAKLVEYVRGRTTPSERVFVWNVSADVLVRLGRRTATRFFHAGAMLDERSYRDQVGEAFRDVERVGPKFILEYYHGSGAFPGIFPPPPGTAGENAPGGSSDRRDAVIPGSAGSWETPALRESKSRLRSRYELAYSDSSGAAVYELKSASGPEAKGTAN